MKRFFTALALIAGAAGLLGPLPAPAQVRAGIYIRVGPPPPRYEYLPPRPPGYGYWHPGRWYWVGGRWVWHGGFWVRGYFGCSWIPGHWNRGWRGWYWVPGHRAC